VGKKNKDCTGPENEALMNTALWVDTFAHRHSLSRAAAIELRAAVLTLRGKATRGAVARLHELVDRAMREREPGDSADALLIAPSEILVCLEGLDLELRYASAAVRDSSSAAEAVDEQSGAS
jgi:hypothetical protein